MSTASMATPALSAGRPESDTRRLQSLRALMEHQPDHARQQAWQWLRELQAASEHYRLAGVFAQGTPPESPDGDCEGIVMNLYGAAWLVAVDRLVRVGQWLGGIGWTGKSFDRAAGTGYNRLSGSSRIAALLVMPRYRFKRINGELTGFRFFHGLEPSPLPPHTMDEAARVMATSPDSVANAIWRAANDRSDRQRYVISLDAHLTLTARKLLSDSLYRSVINTVFGAGQVAFLRRVAARLAV